MRTYAKAGAAEEYHQCGVLQEIESASPHRLIQLLMEGALTRIARARGSMERGQVAEKGRQIGAAIDIVSGLQTSLNHKAEGRLSSNFDALYDYMIRRLLEANLNDEAAGLDEVSDLLREIKSAWDVIGEQLDDI